MKKFCWIRSDKDQGKGSCPFGLPIPEGCKNAGNIITNMCPLELISEKKQETVEKANKRVYIYYKTNERCKYASDIIENKNVVNCDFGDTGAGMKTPNLSGSPLYPQAFCGSGLDGLYSFPLGLYSDNNSSRNLFTGLFSLVGSFDTNLIKKIPNIILNKIASKEVLTEEEILILNILNEKYGLEGKWK